MQEKKRYRAIRKSKDITLKELSENIDLAISTISKYERNQCHIGEMKEKEYIKYIESKAEIFNEY